MAPGTTAVWSSRQGWGGVSSWWGGLISSGQGWLTLIQTQTRGEEDKGGQLVVGWSSRAYVDEQGASG